MAASKRFKVFAYVPSEGWLEHGKSYAKMTEARDDAFETFKGHPEIASFRVVDAKGEVQPKEYPMGSGT